MMSSRNVIEVFDSRPTMEGAGVRLKRVFGNLEVPRFDPFLLLDDFGSDNPDDYLAGFPWHPHRGIETVTYMLEGEIEHADSLGNRGVISSGDVQWMTAGGGIIHQEMPHRIEGRMRGFQLWVNLPAASKMMDPHYRDMPAATIPEVTLGEGVHIKVIAGEVGGVKGPVTDVIVAPEYLDITLDPGASIGRPTPAGHTVFAYVVDGAGRVGPEGERELTDGQVALFGDGESVLASAGETGIRILLISGQPIGEPVAWRGPIVMNTQQELMTAFRQYEEGTFISPPVSG